MSRRHRRPGSHRLTGVNPIVRRAQRRAREDGPDNRPEHDDENNIAQLNNNNSNNNNNNNNDNNIRNQNRYDNRHNVLSHRHSTSYRVFNSIFLQLFSGWAKIRKIELSGVKRPKKPYLFRPFVRHNIPVHNESDLCPLPRSGHRIVVDDDYLYCFGGFNSAIETSNVQPEIFYATEPLFQELWRFSKLTKTWQHLPCTGDIPLTLVSASLILLDNNHLMAFGGSGFPFGQHNSNQIHICDLRKCTWSLLPVLVNEPGIEDNVSGEPLPGYGQAVALDRDKNILYVCGGTDGLNYNCDVHQFDITTRKWSPLSGTIGPEMGRYRHEMALYKGSLYLIGGGTSSVDLPTDIIDKFDIAKREWSRVSTKPWRRSNGRTVTSVWPSGRISHAFVQVDNLIYMIGGRSSEQDFDDAWSLNLDTLQWTLHPEMVLPRATSFLAADCTADGQLSIFGGVYNSLNPSRARRLNSVEEIWIKIPSLKRLALQALVYGCSQTNSYRTHRKPIEHLIKKYRNENVDSVLSLPKH